MIGVVLAVGGLAAAAAPAAAISPQRASEILALKNTGLAELEEGKNADARSTFRKLAAMVPDDPLPPADSAVAALRAGNLPEARQELDRALRLGPNRADLYGIAAAIERAENRPAQERAMLARAAELSPRALEPRWRWIRSAENDPAAAGQTAEIETYLRQILAVSPTSLPALAKLLLVEIRAGKVPAARETAGRLESLLSPMDARLAKFFGEGRALLDGGKIEAASLKFRIVENLLRVSDRYRQSLSELYTDVAGLPLESFSPAFEAALRPGAGPPIAVTFAENRALAGGRTPDSLHNRVDLANSGERKRFEVPAPFHGAAFLDFDLDGDLDVYLYGSAGPDRIRRNNGDGSWSDVNLAGSEAAVSLARAVVTDFDRDGDLDIVGVDHGGRLVWRSNLRQGAFETVPLGVADAVDVAAADLDADGLADLVVATRSGLVLLINRGAGAYERLPGGDLERLPPGFAPRRVILADLDNDGFPDVVAGGESGIAIYRNAGFHNFTAWPVAPKVPARIDEMVAVDLDRDGDLDLLLDTGDGVRALANEGGNRNSWLDVELQGLATGSGKVNRDGIGSFVEVKAGNLYVARTVTPLPTHFGLGPRRAADVVRCLWTNGVPQNLFDQRARTVVREVQQLKGSCPFVYARNGRSGRWSFVSDALGRAPIGLLYDGVHRASPDPRDWLEISGDALAPGADGRLRIDYTEELWEAAFLDMARLRVVDHPAGTEIVPNERSVPQALERKLFTVARPRAVRSATADGRDVTARLARRDHVYVEPGRPTRYQGIRTEHDLVLDLGPLRAGDRVVLFLNGWIFYTDTSINVAVSQRSDLRPYPPILEVPDGAGGWRTAIASFGFPAGKTKTMPVDLTGVVDPSDPRVRIRTTMQIYWDQAFVTVNDPSVALRVIELSPEKATLSYRGFSRRYRETPDGPELFDHEAVSAAPRWPDVPGRLTRYGDVTDLLASADDRWVAFEGGDAIALEYDASRLPPVPAGWRRDYVLVSDGWDKDFDKNTVAGTTVGPYPFHAMSAYPYPPSESFPDPDFLERFLTRPSSAEAFWAFVRDYGGQPVR
jgi:tetratricopeptide (TPR) repeat protein